MPQEVTPYLLYEDVAGARSTGSRARSDSLRCCASTGRTEPHDTPYGNRRYDAYDLEGHLWSFAQRLRNLLPEDWGGTGAG